MNYLNGKYNVEVKDKRYIIHLIEHITVRKRKPAKFLRSHYQVINEKKVGKNQKVFENEIDELQFEKYPKKKKPIFEKPKTNLHF